MGRRPGPRQRPVPGRRPARRARRLPVASLQVDCDGRPLDARCSAPRSTRAARASGEGPRGGRPRMGGPARTRVRSARGDGPAATAGRGPQARARGACPGSGRLLSLDRRPRRRGASWLAFRDCLIEHEVELRASFERPVQTNEPGRARPRRWLSRARGRDRPAAALARAWRERGSEPSLRSVPVPIGREERSARRGAGG